MGYLHTKVSKCSSNTVNFRQVDCRASGAFSLWAHCISLHEACFFFLIFGLIMAKDPAVLLYTSDFLTGTIFFTDEQVGKYIRLLCAQHQKGHIPPDNFNKISNNDPEIAKKFIKDRNGFYYNKRMEFETNKRSAYIDSRKRNLLKGRKLRNPHMKAHMEQHMDSHMENENEDRNEDLKEGVKGEKIITWRNSFEEYLKITNKAIKELLKDEKELQQQQEFQPNLDIPLTLKKAYKNFWGTKAGWNNKKKSRTKDIDMRMTFINAISQKINKVYKTEDERPEGLAV